MKWDRRNEDTGAWNARVPEAGGDQLGLLRGIVIHLAGNCIPPLPKEETSGKRNRVPADWHLAEANRLRSQQLAIGLEEINEKV
jgi:hypothetical protein